MKGAASVILLVVGCYSPTYQSGTPCSTACPGDLVCVDHVCREPGYVPPVDGPSVDGPPGDVDADGIANDVDNCPSVANIDQHDEDDDKHGDVCDPCPHLAGDLADADGDKVGDACDPQPAIAKQVVRFFDPFTSDRTEWKHDPGASRSGETLRLVSGAYTELSVTTGSLRIAIGGTIDAVGTGEHQLAIAFGFGPTGKRYHYVEFYDNAGQNGATAITKANDSTYAVIVQQPYAGTFPLGALAMRVDESVALQQITLESVRGGAPQALLTGSTASAPTLISSSYISLFAQGLDARIRYVWVVETVP